MKHQAYQSTGFSLIIGAFLVIVTMVMHPSGGSMERILSISKTITITHALAIFSLPFISFGFYGLTHKLMDTRKIAVLAFLILIFGLIAAMFAALVNGLTVPYFLGDYAHRLEENREVLGPILNYSFALNTPLDYIFIVGCCLAIVLYSISILMTHTIPKWLGYFGIIFGIFVGIGALTGFVFTSLTGFRIVTFSIAAWILCAGFFVMRTKPDAT